MVYTFSISEIEYKLLRDFIHDRFGIHFKDDRLSFFRMRLAQRLISLGLSSFRDYFNYIKWDVNREKEILKMMSLLTNNETYFFREFTQLEVFRDFILEEIWTKKLDKNERNLKVLSAGCSTGEEVYSLAVLLFESGKFYGNWNLSIKGIDINERALNIAKSGIYYEKSLRLTDSAKTDRYFVKDNEKFVVKDIIKKFASFEYGNIADPETWERESQVDVLLCRNVLIYFSEQKIEQTINHFYRSIKNGGYLFLGHAETLNRIATKFELKRYPGAMIYQKKE